VDRPDVGGFDRYLPGVAPEPHRKRVAAFNAAMESEPSPPIADARTIARLVAERTPRQVLRDFTRLCRPSRRVRRATTAPVIARTRGCARERRPAARRPRARRAATSRDDGGGKPGEPEPGRASRPDLSLGVVA
jgi:hypothetical protein